MRSFNVAVAQSIAIPRDVPQSVCAHVRLAKVAAEHGVCLVVFPELSLTRYDQSLTVDDALVPSDPRLRPLQVFANDTGIVIVAGAPVTSSIGLHIAAIAFTPGARPTTYLKQHLHGGEEVAFAPGRGDSQLAVSGQFVALAICADIAHPEHILAAAQAGSQIYAAGCLITKRNLPSALAYTGPT